MSLFDKVKQNAAEMKESVQKSADTIYKIQLKSPLEQEELLQILLQCNAVTNLGQPEIKRGITGKVIAFPKFSRVTPQVSIKDTTVTVKKILDSSQTKVSFGSAGGSTIDVALDKDLRGKNGINTINNGSDYFIAVHNAVETALQDYKA